MAANGGITGRAKAESNSLLGTRRLSEKNDDFRERNKEFLSNPSHKNSENLTSHRLSVR